MTRRREHGALLPVYVRVDEATSRALDRIRNAMAEAELQYVSRGEAARRLLELAIKRWDNTH